MTTATNTNDEVDVTIEQLQSDWESLQGRAKEVLTGLVSASDIAKFLRGDLLPFIANHVATTIDIDGTIEDLVTGAEEILHEESAAVLSSVIIGGRGLAMKVVELAPKDASGNLMDKALAKVLKEYGNVCDQAERLIEEITIGEPEEEGEAGGEDDDPDGEDEDEGDENDQATEGDEP